jgi:hypothetical protein
MDSSSSAGPHLYPQDDCGGDGNSVLAGFGGQTEHARGVYRLPVRRSTTQRVLRRVTRFNVAPAALRASVCECA